MSRTARKVILFSKSGYSRQYDVLLNRLIDEKVLLFFALGEGCDLWHDVMDEILVGNGQERDFFMMTTWHTGESLEEVAEFAGTFEFAEIDNDKIEIIEI